MLFVHHIRLSRENKIRDKSFSPRIATLRRWPPSLPCPGARSTGPWAWKSLRTRVKLVAASQEAHEPSILGRQRGRVEPPSPLQLLGRLRFERHEHVTSTPMIQSCCVREGGERCVLEAPPVSEVAWTQGASRLAIFPSYAGALDDSLLPLGRRSTTPGRPCACDGAMDAALRALLIPAWLVRNGAGHAERDRGGCCNVCAACVWQLARRRVWWSCMRVVVAGECCILKN